MMPLSVPEAPATRLRDAANLFITVPGHALPIAVWARRVAAIRAWGRQAPQDLGRIALPVLVANGDTDIMVPTVNNRDLAARIPVRNW